MRRRVYIFNPLDHLTFNEEAGYVMPKRQHQLPSDWPSPVSRFMA